MTPQPLQIDCPEPPSVPDPTVSNTPPDFAPDAQKRPRTRQGRTEFQLLGDIQAAFLALPTDASRKRAWEWITGWLAETFPPPQPVPFSQLAESFLARLPQDAQAYVEEDHKNA